MHLLFQFLLEVAVLGLTLLLFRWLPWPAMESSRWPRPRGIAAAAVAVFLLSAALSGLRRAEPSVHDEFSYQLAGSTFAAGRLTNPAHPLWPSFQTFHVIQQPTRQSKYPPAQGMFLAAGELLGGRSIVGIWLQMSLAAAALYWALSAVVAPHWACFGALLPTVRFGSLAYWKYGYFAYWNASYWGGGAALLGAALVLGAWLRLRQRPVRAASVLLGVGIAVLANSRPYEGAVVTALVGFALVFERFRQGGVKDVLSTLAPCAAVLTVAALWMGYYNWRVVGDPWKLPYQVYLDSYDAAPAFAFQNAREIRQDFPPEIRRWHEDFALEIFRGRRAKLIINREELLKLWTFFIGPALVIPLVAAVFAGRRRIAAFSLGVVAVSLAAQSVVALDILPHYMAPAIPFLLLILVQGLAALEARPLGRGLAAGVVAACLASFLAGGALRAFRWSPPPGYFADVRAAIQRDLERQGGRHVIFVRYGPDHNPHHEWVWNDPDIDAAPVVWAREIDPGTDQRVLDYFSGRTFWRVEPDRSPAALAPLARGSIP